MTAEQKTEVEQELKDAYGAKLESPEVKSVKVTYGGSSFPFAGMDDMEMAYVSYRLQGSDVLIANLVDVSYQDLAASGMIPTKGSLASRMTEDEFQRLLEAYAAETSKPLGSVYRYNESSAYYSSDSTSDQITVAGKKYATDELWAATEGVEVTGDKYESGSSSVTCYVFYEDPETGVFTFLGTEPGSTMW